MYTLYGTKIQANLSYLDTLIDDISPSIKEATCFLVTCYHYISNVPKKLGF